MPDPLTKEELLKLIKSLEAHQGFKASQARMANWRALRWREAGVDISGITEKLEYRTPGIAANIDRFRNRLRAADIKILVAAKDEKEESVKAAQKVENFFYILYYDFRRQSDADDRALDFQVADGLGPRNLAWADDVLDKLFGSGEGRVTDLDGLRSRLEGGFAGNPFKLRVPDPMVVYYDKDKSVVVEAGPVFKSSIKAAYSDGVSEQDRPTFDAITSEPVDTTLGYEHPERTVQFYHVECKAYIYEAIVDGEADKSLLLRTSPNPCGRPRYTFAAGHRTSGGEPWQEYRPLVHDLYPIGQLINICRTLLNSGALQTGRPLYQKVMDGRGGDDFMTLLSKPSEERNVITIDTSQAVWPDAGPGMHWEPVPIPDPATLLAATERLEMDFDRLGFPQILAPDAAIDATSGYDRARQMEGAQDFLDPPLTNVAHAWQELFLLAADAIKEVNLPVTIRTLLRSEGENARVQDEVTIKPEDFRDIHLEVRFESIPATVQFAIDEANRRDVELGFMARSTYMGTKYDDPERERKQVALDDVRGAAEEQAKQAALAFIQSYQEADVQQVAGELGVPLPAQNPRMARPAGGAMPGLGAPPVPPMQSEPGAPVPEGTPAIEGAAAGVAQ